MNNRLLQSKIPFLFFSVLLLAASVYLIAMNEPHEMMTPDTMAFSVNSDECVHTVKLWKDDGVYYLFLPSYARMDSISIQNSDEFDILFNGNKVSPTTFSDVEFKREYSLTIEGITYPIVFMHSDNVATMYIDTKTEEEIKHIHADKTYKGKAVLSFVDCIGNEEYTDSRHIAKVNSRGNSTWRYEKKPYSLTLQSPAALIGESINKEYVLIANAIDKTNMRNKIMYELAKETDDGWNVSSKYVDLFINGEYRGLYLLTDRVEVSETRLNLPEDCILYNLEYNSRAQSEAVKDIVPNITAELINPKAYSQAEKEKAEAEIRRIFGAITANKVADEDLHSYMDLDSWASLYICQEFSSNVDSGTCSLFFYLKDGKLYAGPLWDYDNTFGLRKEYQADGFCARIMKTSPLWSSLVQFDSFNRKVSELYENIFRPEIAELLSGKYAELSEKLKTPNELDNKRWHGFEISFFADTYIYDFSGFIAEKMQFLDDVWINGTEHCSVSVNVNGKKSYFSPASGSTGESIKQRLFCYYPDIEIERYCDSKTGKQFDFSLPITQNTELTVIEKEE